MSPKDLFAVAVAAMAVWFISNATVSLLAHAVRQDFAYLFVGLMLLAVAGFIWRSGPWPR